MVFGGVRTDDDDHVRIGARGERGGDRPRADPLEEGGDRRGVAQARAVIDVVRAEAGADEFLDEVRLFVRPLGGAEAREGPSAVPIPDAPEPGGRPIEGFFPARLTEVGPRMRGIDRGVRSFGASSRRTRGRIRRSGCAT